MATIPYSAKRLTQVKPSRKGHPASQDIPQASEPLHRIKDVRMEEGLTIRAAAERMDITVGQALEEEKEHADLRLSQLLRWQRALRVPMDNLFQEDEGALSRPVRERAVLLRIMKTARAIQERAGDEDLGHMANTLVQQLTELMPELEEVGAWISYGQPRSMDEVGRIAETVVPDDLVMRRAM